MVKKINEYYERRRLIPKPNLCISCFARITRNLCMICSECGGDRIEKWLVA